MTILFDWLCGSMAESLCLALLHSLWQGAAWGVLLLLILRRIPDDRPRVRYVVALGCLYGLLGGACLTWSILRYEAAVVHDGTPLAASAVEMGKPEAIEGGVPSTFSVDGATASLPLRFADSVPWVVAVWLVGASICLLLSSRNVAAARRLRLGQPIDDPNTRRLLDRLISSFGLSRPIRLLSVDGLLTPGVVGVLKPAILIPASLVTGLTPDQWEAILAHELAHIRRWDYLVHLSQLVIESLLFFNPAVWWLSRQVNLEREACCDASAVGLTARPVQYATLLVDLAERLHSGSAAAAPTVAFSREQSSPLMERVRRIVTPGRRSELTIRRPMAISFLVLSLLAVALLQAGTDIAVAVAADILSDEERVETLVESAKDVDEAAPGLGGEEKKLTIRGVISVEGDERPTAPVWIIEKRRYRSGTTTGTVCGVDLAEESEFDVTVGPGITWLVFRHPDFADTVVGPYGPDDGPLVTDVSVLLERGIDVPVIILDDHGSPVPEARILPITAVGGSTYRGAVTTDKNGQMVLKHINPDLDYRLLIMAPGCQTLHAPLQKLEANSTLRLEMLRATPATGLIVNQQGDAVAGAKVKGIYRRQRGFHAQIDGDIDEPSAVSDTEGHFQLGELKDGWVYDLLVEAPGHAPTTVRDVRPGDEDVRIEIAPALTVQGTVVGSKEQLEQLWTRHAIRWTLEFPRVPKQTKLSIYGSLPCEVVDGVGKFTLPPMAPGTLYVSAGDSSVKQELTGSIDDLRIDLSDPRQLKSAQLPPKRPVRITFTRDGKTVSPWGTLQMSNWQLGSNVRVQRSYSIERGVLETQVYVPDRLHFGCEGMIGFWFNSHDPTTEVVAGEETLEIAIPVLPAGAVTGVILNADGTPAYDASASVRYELAYRTDTRRNNYGGGARSKTNHKGEFFVSPIPLGAECSIRATRNKYIALGDEFTMDADSVLPSFVIQLGRPVDAKVRLLDPSGAPLAGQPIGLHCQHPLAPHSWSPPEITNRKGECRFDRLNPDLEGHYVAKFESIKDYIPASIPLKLNGKTTVLRVQRGSVIFGVLLDSQGEPVSGAKLRAQPVNWRSNKDLLILYDPEAPTDLQGKFRFSNLPPVKMRLRGAGHDVEATPTAEDRAKPVIVRMPR